MYEYAFFHFLGNSNHVLMICDRKGRSYLTVYSTNLQLQCALQSRHCILLWIKFWMFPSQSLPYLSCSVSSGYRLTKTQRDVVVSAGYVHSARVSGDMDICLFCIRLHHCCAAGPCRSLGTLYKVRGMSANDNLALIENCRCVFLHYGSYFTSVSCTEDSLGPFPPFGTQFSSSTIPPSLHSHDDIP